MHTITTYLLVLLLSFSTATAFAQKQIVLENSTLRATFDPQTGALTRMTDKRSSWELIQRPHLAQSFQMLVPIEGARTPFEQERRFNPVNGLDQPAPKVIASNDQVTFIWKTIRSKHGPRNLDITLTATAALTPGGLRFSGRVENRSPYTVEYVAWPYFGELALPDLQSDFFLDTKNYCKSLFPHFPSEHGYWGVDYPTSMAYLPGDSYFLLRNERQGVIVHSGKQVREFVIGSFELAPGYEFAAQNPRTTTMDGQDVRIIFKANRVLYAKNNQTCELQPLDVCFYQGNWQEGLAPLRNRPKERDGWMDEPGSWRRTSASSPRQLITHAKDAAANGVSVLSIYDWGGADDERLFMPKPGYREAIEACRKLGVRVVLESDFLRADASTEHYRNTLEKLIVTDPYGFFYNKFIMCPLSKEVQTSVAEAYACSFASLGVDGMICTDPPFRIKIVFCHNPAHRHKVPEYTNPALIGLDRDFIARAKQADKEFKVGGSYLFDEQSDDFDCMVLPQLESREALRFCNPGRTIVAPVDVRSARADMNICLKNQYTIGIAPLFHTGTLACYPNMVKYLRQIEALRRQYPDYLWKSTMIPSTQAEVSGATAYAIYQAPRSGKRAVVVVNNDATRDAMVTVRLNGAQTGSLSVITPEQPVMQPIAGSITIPVLSTAVIIEN